MPSPFGSIGQIAYTVSDVPRSVAFYRDALGIAHLRLDPALCQLVIRLALMRFPGERWDARQCDRMAAGG